MAGRVGPEHCAPLLGPASHLMPYHYVIEGEPRAKDGFVDLDENLPGLGLTVNERALEKFDVVE